MKIILIIMGSAFVLVAGVMTSLVRSGGALKPAGVIKPTEIRNDSSIIGSQVAARLFPDFHEANHVIWRIEGGDEVMAEVVRTAFAHYQSSNKPSLLDLRNGTEERCAQYCWYIVSLDKSLPDSLAPLVKAETTAEVFIQYFEREEIVPESCNSEKILTLKCMRPVSVREVRRKIKTPAPHFFMQRYLKSQFYLFIEQKSS